MKGRGTDPAGAHSTSTPSSERGNSLPISTISFASSLQCRSNIPVLTHTGTIQKLYRNHRVILQQIGICETGPADRTAWADVRDDAGLGDEAVANSPVVENMNGSAGGYSPGLSSWSINVERRRGRFGCRGMRQSSECWGAPHEPTPCTLRVYEAESQKEGGRFASLHWTLARAVP